MVEQPGAIRVVDERQAARAAVPRHPRAAIQSRRRAGAAVGRVPPAVRDEPPLLRRLHRHERRHARGRVPLERHAARPHAGAPAAVRRRSRTTNHNGGQLAVRRRTASSTSGYRLRRRRARGRRVRGIVARSIRRATTGRASGGTRCGAARRRSRPASPRRTSSRCNGSRCSSTAPQTPRRSISTRFRWAARPTTCSSSRRRTARPTRSTRRAGRCCGSSRRRATRRGRARRRSRRRRRSPTRAVSRSTRLRPAAASTSSRLRTVTALWSVSITKLPSREKIAAALNFANGHVIATTGGYIGDAPPYQGHVAIISPGGALLHVWNSLCSNRRGLIDPASCPRERLRDLGPRRRRRRPGERPAARRDGQRAVGRQDQLGRRGASALGRRDRAARQLHADEHGGAELRRRRPRLDLAGRAQRRATSRRAARTGRSAC